MSSTERESAAVHRTWRPSWATHSVAYLHSWRALLYCGAERSEQGLVVVEATLVHETHWLTIPMPTQGGGHRGGKGRRQTGGFIYGETRVWKRNGGGSGVRVQKDLEVAVVVIFTLVNNRKVTITMVSQSLPTMLQTEALLLWKIICILKMILNS